TRPEEVTTKPAGSVDGSTAGKFSPLATCGTSVAHGLERGRADMRIPLLLVDGTPEDRLAGPLLPEPVALRARLPLEERDRQEQRGGEGGYPEDEYCLPDFQHTGTLSHRADGG